LAVRKLHTDHRHVETIQADFHAIHQPGPAP
jgi:hypothetical protein